MTPARSRSDEGFILVVVLVLLMALATLASIYSVYAGNSAAESLVPEDRLRAEVAARSAVELAVMQLLGPPAAQRAGHGDFAARIGAASIAVSYRTEAARVDLNAAAKELISGLFQSLGSKKDAADGFADRILGWRTKVEPGKPNPEPAAYRTAGLNYAPRQAPFDSVFELYLVTGLPRDLVDRVLPYVTIYNGHAGIDIAEASPQVIAAIPGLAPDVVAAVLAARAKGADPKALMQLLGAASNGATTDAGQAYRADVLVELRNRRVRAEIVFSLEDDASSPYDILYWRDDFDGPLPSV